MNHKPNEVGNRESVKNEVRAESCRVWENLLLRYDETLRVKMLQLTRPYAQRGAGWYNINHLLNF